jgi:hypothetical protein
MNKNTDIAPKIIVAALPALLAMFLLGKAYAADEDHVAAATAQERIALEVVERRTAAYNDHDIDAFLATYHENVRVYEYADRLLGKGTERMRRIFGPQFSANDGRIVVHARHALENTVVSDETVTFYGKTEHNIGVYTIEGGLIVEVRLIEPAE